MKRLPIYLALAFAVLSAGCAVDPKTRTSRETCTQAGDTKYVVTRAFGIPIAIEIDERDAEDCKRRAAAQAKAPAAEIAKAAP